MTSALARARRAALVSWHLLYNTSHDAASLMDRRNVPKRIRYQSAANLRADVARYLDDLSTLIFLQGGRLPKEEHSKAWKTQTARLREAEELADIEEEEDRKGRRLKASRRARNAKEANP